MAKILLVEGDGEALNLLKSALELEGHEVLPVQEGQAGINNGMKRCPDLLVVGTDLGDKDAGSVYRALMGLHGQERFKAIFISKPENPPEIPPAWKNIIGQFEKPVNEKEIVERIRSQFGTPAPKPPEAASPAEGAPGKERRALPKELRGLTSAPRLQKDRAGIDKLEEAIRSFPRATVLKKPVKKKSQMGLWIILLFIWGAGGGAFYFLYWKPTHPSPEERVPGGRVTEIPGGGPPPPPPPPEPPSDIFEKANGYEVSGSTELAIMTYKRAIEQGAKNDPWVLKSRIRLAEFYRKMGRFDESLKHYDEYIKFAPSEAGRAEAILKTAEIYFYKKTDVRNALKRCQFALADPAASAKTKSEASRLQEKVQKEKVVSDILLDIQMDFETDRKAIGKKRLRDILKKYPNTVFKATIKDRLEE